MARFQRFTPLLFLLILCISNSCSFLSSEPPIEKERKELNKMVNGHIVAFYKGAKIGIRTRGFTDLPADESGVSLGEELSTFYKQMARFVIDVSDTANPPTMSAAEMIDLGKALYQLPEKIEHIDEDDYPTILLLVVGSLDTRGTTSSAVYEMWSSNAEHLCMALLLDAGRLVKTPASWRIYELSKVDPIDFTYPNMSSLAWTYKGWNYYLEGWNYLAEEQYSAGIEFLNTGVPLMPMPIPGMGPVEGLNEIEATRTYYHALDHLLRALARREMDTDEKHELALQDIKVFMDDCEKLQLENELYWVAGAYYHIHMEESEKAIEFLQKLETSPFINDREKELLQETQTYLADREPDKAMNKVFDKVFMAKLATRYMVAVAKETEWYQEFERSPAIQKFNRTLDNVGAEVKEVEDKLSLPDIDL